MPSRNQSRRVVFNGHDLSRIVDCRVAGRVMAPVDDSWTEVPGRDGETFSSSRLKGYDVEVEMWLPDEARMGADEARRRLAAALATDGPAPLSLPDAPDLHVLALVTGETEVGDPLSDRPGVTVTFHVGDPARYGRRRVVEVPAGGSATFDAGGDLPAWCVVEAEPGAARSWTVTNRATGEHVTLDSATTAGSSVKADMAAERVTVNGQDAPVTLDSDYFTIEGRVTLSVSSGPATVRWEERWL